jgi:membrane protease YdiL (CAAX protease family)
MTNAESLETSHLTSRSIALWEIVSVLTSGMLAEWVVLAFAGRSKAVMAIPLLLALSLMIFSHRERAESLRMIGFRTDKFFAALRLLLLPTVIAILGVLAFRWFSSHSIIIAPWRSRLLLLPVWALFQQYVLNGFVNRRAQMVFGKGMKTTLAVAFFFALLHLPNPPLAALTFVAGLIWAAVYQRHPNLFAVALSHALISLTLALTAPGDLLNSLRVGFKYFG